MSYIGTGVPNRALTSADIAQGAVTLDDISFTDQPTNLNILGTIDKHTMRLTDGVTVTGDVTLSDNLIFSKLSDDGNAITLTDDGSTRTITGTGSIEASTLAQTPNSSLTGMTGELGSTVTGSPNLNLTTGTIGSAVNLNHDAKNNAWHIYRSGTVLYSSNTVLNFDVNALLGSNLTVSGGRVTIGTAGLYWIGCAIGHNGNQVDTDNFHFRINTTMLIGSTLYQSITGAGINYSGISSSFVVELNANDIVDYYGNGYIYGGAGDPMTYFSGCRLGASS